jgi:hypothetical protein
VTFDEMEQALRKRFTALPSAARAELLPVFRLPDFDRADRDLETRTSRRAADRPGGGQGGAGGGVWPPSRDGAEVVLPERTFPIEAISE